MPTRSEPAEQALLEAEVCIADASSHALRLAHGGSFVAHVSSDRRGDALVAGAADDVALDALIDALFRDLEPGARVVRRDAGRALVRGRLREGSVAGVIAAADALALLPAPWRDGRARYTLLVETREQLEGLARSLARLGPLSLARVAEAPADALAVCVTLASLTDGFTSRQLDALLGAVGNGYYESPRRVGTDVIAGSFGLSRSTFEEHLRKAERRALERFVAAVGAHEPLARVNGRRGRPASRRSVRLPDLQPPSAPAAEG